MRLILAFLVTFALCADAGSLRHRRLRMTTAPNNVHGCAARWVAWQAVTAGGTWTDATGRGHNATLLGNAYASAGVGLHTPDASSSARVAASTYLEIPVLTSMAWCQRPDRVGYPALMYAGNASPTYVSWDLLMFEQAVGCLGGALYNYNGSSWQASQYCTSNDTNVPEWVHFAMVLDPSSGRLDIYVNGTKEVGTSAGVVSPAIHYQAGWYLTLLGGWANAVANDFRIYSRALTDAEVTRIYAAGR